MMCKSYLHEVYKVVKLIEAESKCWLPGFGEGEIGSCCLKTIEFQFYMMKELRKSVA